MYAIRSYYDALHVFEDPLEGRCIEGGVSDGVDGEDVIVGRGKGAVGPRVGERGVLVLIDETSYVSAGALG